MCSVNDENKDDEKKKCREKKERKSIKLNVYRCLMEEIKKKVVRITNKPMKKSRLCRN